MPAQINCNNYPPEGYHVNHRFPSICWPPHACNLYSVYQSWRFTLLWTMIFFSAFHLGATAIALVMQIGKPKSIWTYLVAIPVIYVVVAGIEALVVGSITGSILGAIYQAGCYEMSTWIPFVWGIINTLVLIVSSFTIQGAL
ncbi:integral membrane protein [Xylariaceae sp. FL1272]|nr:integral membrane protein [Xylariaceae sp. FL1272]